MHPNDFVYGALDCVGVSRYVYLCVYVFFDAQNGILLASVSGIHKMSLLLCVPRSCVFVCLCVGMFIAERMLRQDEKKNQRFSDGYMVRSSVGVEADLQRELERER